MAFRDTPVEVPAASEPEFKQTFLPNSAYLARAVGIGLILIGGALAVHHLLVSSEYYSQATAQQAQVLDTLDPIVDAKLKMGTEGAAKEQRTTDDGTERKSVDTELPTTQTTHPPVTESSSDVTISSRNKNEHKNPVRIATNESSVASGKLPIYYSVEGATRVTAHVFHKEEQKYYTLGNATRVNDGEWRYEWDTSKYPDGTYRLRALVVHSSGSYDASGEYVEVANASLPAVAENNEHQVTITNTPATTEVSKQSIRNATIEVLADNPVNGDVRILVAATDARIVEVYAIPSAGNVQQYVGLAQPRKNTTWEFVWNTNTTPNGRYELFARIKTEYGTFDTKQATVVVANTVVSTQTPAAIARIEAVRESKTRVEEIARMVPATSSLDSSLTGTETDPVVANAVRDAVNMFKVTADEELTRLAVAVRAGNQEQAEAVKNTIESKRAAVVAEVRGGNAVEETADVVRTQIESRVKEEVASLIAETERREQIIRERVGEDVFIDSDNDSISDYDEVHLYATDPFSADSDGDGFVDGAEVLNGYDPTNAHVEAQIAYESPRSEGVVRDDLLRVESITAISPDPDDTIPSGVSARAVISGTALPNSYVTLYIFSTPTIVTVKTTDDGSWSYQFDKELEDGTHEVYVGITDNAGRIVAKSNPFSFVKEAQAFTATANAAGPTELASEHATSVYSEELLLVIASLVVMLIGFVLLLLGMHIRSQQSAVKSKINPTV